ncbi:MAG: choice-of-anchor J domain-containing protein, partial [Prevotella sp.]|nr:choice-of-anchor J domain-containing protein [Prevotella sp.]
DGEMAFFSRISSEQGWDYGYFYIDNQQMGAYTGEGNWGERKFPVTAGDHTFKWEYTEDFIISQGDDCFYVDYITFYRQPEPLGAGWHTYLEGEFNDALMSNLTSNPSFGYHYPTSITGQYNGFQLTKVSMFSDALYGAVGGTYTVNIYQGGSIPGEGTLVSTQTVELPVGLGEWVDWDLNTPVSVNGNQDLWVIYYVNQAGGMGYPAGMCNTDSNPNGDWWDGGSGWENYGGGVWTMRNYFTDRSGRSVVLGTAANSGNAPIAQSEGAPIVSKLRQYVKGEDNTVAATSINPGAPSKPLVMPIESNRALSHYRIYRTDCYNDGPYTEENTVLLATNWPGDTVYIDVEWTDLEPGIYKWGVGVVYEGNRGQEIAGPINWSDPVNVNRATLTYDFDDSSLQGWTTIDANNDGYNWVLGSQIGGVYLVAGASLEGSGHDSSTDMMCSGSYSNATSSAITPDNYLVSPQVALGGSISFWACAQDAGYAAEHFAVAVSTSGNTNASDFTTVQEWTMTAKGASSVMSYGRDGSNRAQGSWYQYTVDLSAYSGMGYVAIRHFNCNDQFILNVDDITIVEGAGGPTPPTPPTPGVGGLQEPRESEIVWSNCLEKGMWLGANDVEVTVLLNSADSPEGTTVSFVNLNEAEQEL